MQKLWQKQRLLLKLMVMSLAVVVVSLLAMYVFLVGETKNRVLQDQGQQLLAIGQEVAVNPQVIEAVQEEETSTAIQEYAHKVEGRFQLDYLVIILSNSIRLTHPNHALIGSRFQGENDQHQALKEGKSYYHTGDGPLGRSLRAFVPIYDNQGQIIGAVSLGITLPNLKRFIDRTNSSLVRALLASLLPASVLTFILALSLKHQMLGMEPQEIASVLEERNAMFERTRDPIILLDPLGQVTYMNEEGHQNWPALEGQTIDQLFEMIALEEAKQLQLVETQSGRSFVASLAQVQTGKQLRGYLLILRETSELQTLVKQLDHSEYFAQELAKQNHDFMNKLHVIYGLAEFERIDDLKHYLEDLTQAENSVNQTIPLLINNSAIAGHLLVHQASSEIYTEIQVENEIPLPKNYQETSHWLGEIHYFEEWYQSSSEWSATRSQVFLSLNYQEQELITDIWLDDLEQVVIDEVINRLTQRPGWQLDQGMIGSLHLKLIIEYGGLNDI